MVSLTPEQAAQYQTGLVPENLLEAAQTMKAEANVMSTHVRRRQSNSFISSLRVVFASIKIYRLGARR